MIFLVMCLVFLKPFPIFRIPREMEAVSVQGHLSIRVCHWLSVCAEKLQRQQQKRGL